jgi:lipoprotein-releasing system permease protein
MVSIGVSVAAFVLVLCVMSGLHHNINLRILALEPHVIVEFDKKITTDVLQAHPVAEFLTEKKNAEVQLFDRQDVMLRTVDGIFHFGVARGVTEKTMTSMQEKLASLPRQASASFSAAFDIPEVDEVIMGSSLAKQMNIYEGDYVTVFPPEGLLMAPGESPPFAKVLVKQIISTNISELDTQMVLYQRGKSLLNFSKSGSRRIGYDVWLDDPYDASRIKKDLSQFKDVQVETWRERNSAVFMALRMEKLMLGSFLGLSALITTFSIWSVLTLLITQKRREMGLLMAIGFSNHHLRDLFQRVGLYLAGIGLGVGMLFGILTSLYLEKYPLRVLPDIYYDSEVPARVDLIFVLLVLAIAIGIIYGAVRLAMARLLTLKPSEALRSN